VIALSLPSGYLGLISPLVITYIVTKVTGPMLENIFLQKYPSEYRAYMATTNYFIPNFFSGTKPARQTKPSKNGDGAFIASDTSSRIATNRTDKDEGTNHDSDDGSSDGGGD